MKDLKDKAVKIKGKDYVLVKDRILALAEKGEYSIETNYDYFPERKMWVVKATLAIKGHSFTGLAQELEGEGYINKTSALENAETSAVGRACAMAGIGVIDSIASVDEINKAQTREFNTSKAGEAIGSGEVPFGDNNDKCPKCGADMKMKKDGTGVYCSDLCWKK